MPPEKCDQAFNPKKQITDRRKINDACNDISAIFEELFSCTGSVNR
jgi:hypothetical protein